ncbi:hypothetical protein Y1Q_0000557 [Alligator mississippiensis]|uniref:Uncharacterized protein n=1 Tax=Alligator mississippiensis TaxID=8496 RepID=A0A151MBI2_ALLMI|nr:hypothetical protein Y1Q_0000557 [Alligator mississippiensis]
MEVKEDEPIGFQILKQIYGNSENQKVSRSEGCKTAVFPWPENDSLPGLGQPQVAEYCWRGKTHQILKRNVKLVQHQTGMLIGN